MWWARLLNVISGLLGGGAAPDLGAYEAISTVTVGGGGSSSITFSSIPSTYKHLQIRVLSRSNRAYTLDALKLRFNSDSSNNYAFHYLNGDGSSASAGGLTSASLTYVPTPNMAGNTATANIFGACVIDILDYTNTNKTQTVRMLGGTDLNGSGYSTFQSGLWLSTNAVTQIDLTPEVGSSFNQYSSFALYGIKG